MEALSSRYGWTPAQIREQSAEDIEAYLEIIRAEANLSKRKNHSYGRPAHT